MFEKTYHATHPDMMHRVENDELRDRHLVSGLFLDGRVVLNYSHNERFVIGGATPAGTVLSLPEQSEPDRELASTRSSGPWVVKISITRT